MRLIQYEEATSQRLKDAGSAEYRPGRAIVSPAWTLLLVGPRVGRAGRRALLKFGGPGCWLECVLWLQRPCPSPLLGMVYRRVNTAVDPNSSACSGWASNEPEEKSAIFPTPGPVGRVCVRANVRLRRGVVRGPTNPGTGRFCGRWIFHPRGKTVAVVAPTRRRQVEAGARLLYRL